MKLFKVYPTDHRYGGFLTVAAEGDVQVKYFVEDYIQKKFVETYSTDDIRYAFVQFDKEKKCFIEVLWGNVEEIKYATFNESFKNVIYRDEEYNAIVCDNCIYDSWD